MRARRRTFVGPVLSVFFAIVVTGCHPPQLEMPTRKISPMVSLTVPTVGNAVGEQPRRARLLSLAFRPEHDQIAGGYSDGRVRIWDIAAKQVVKQFEYGDEVGALAFSPDGKKLAAADGTFGSRRDKPGLIRIWDVEGGAVAMEMHGRAGPVTALAWSGGPRSLLAAAFGEERNVRVWDTATGDAIEKLDARGGADVTLSFSDEGRYFCVGGLAEIYDVPTDKTSHFKLYALRHAGSVVVLPVMNCYVLVTPATQDEVWPLCVFNDCGHPAEIWTAPLNPDSKPQAWYVPKQAGFTGPIAVTCSEPRHLVAISSMSGSTSILLWDVQANKLTSQLEAEPKSRLAATVFDRTGSRAAAADSAMGTVYLWDVASAKPAGVAAGSLRAK